MHTISKTLLAVFVGSFLLPQISAGAQQELANLTSVSVGNRPVLQIVSGSGSGGTSARQRAAGMQQRLNQALQNASVNKEKVQVLSIDGEPQLYLGTTCIGPIDVGTARALGLSRDQLAHKWADALSAALGDGQLIRGFISELQSQPDTAAPPPIRFASLPEGLELPISLASTEALKSLHIGAPLELQTSRDVSLLSGETITAGTMLHGQVNSLIHSGDVNAVTDQTLVQLSVESMTLRDGTHFPIAARVQPATVSELRKGKALSLRLQTRAQVAVTSTVL